MNIGVSGLRFKQNRTGQLSQYVAGSGAGGLGQSSTLITRRAQGGCNQPGQGGIRVKHG